MQIQTNLNAGCTQVENKECMVAQAVLRQLSYLPRYETGAMREMLEKQIQYLKSQGCPC